MPWIRLRDGIPSRPEAPRAAGTGRPEVPAVGEAFCGERGVKHPRRIDRGIRLP